MIQEYLSEELIQLDIQVEMREEVIDRLAELMEAKGIMARNEDFLYNVFERERNGTTSMGSEIAIPYGTSKDVNRSAIAVARLIKPIYWDDGNPVSYVFLIAALKGEETVLYSSLKEKLMDQKVREQLKIASTPVQVVSALQI
ncbi:PTS sugar transporter subunit IIA [Thermoflavimicrobium daqui]|nr:PTS sugar transporter subunit IIA [Thermoflavimicrobium daqui]